MSDIVERLQALVENSPEDRELLDETITALTAPVSDEVAAQKLEIAIETLNEIAFSDELAQPLADNALTLIRAMGQEKG